MDAALCQREIVGVCDLEMNKFEGQPVSREIIEEVVSLAANTMISLIVNKPKRMRKR